MAKGANAAAAAAPNAISTPAASAGITIRFRHLFILFLSWLNYVPICWGPGVLKSKKRAIAIAKKRIFPAARAAGHATQQKRK
jgi:hypothetical protein